VEYAKPNQLGIERVEQWAHFGVTIIGIELVVVSNMKIPARKL